jgi:hypothetical protein
MPRLSPKVTALVAATAAAGFSGAAIAGAADSASSSSSATSTAKQRPATGRGAGETALTGTTKEKVEAAALAKVKGTVLRTETDADGVYESHIRKGDGTVVEVRVGKAFTVTGVETEPAGGRGRHGGPGDGRQADLAAVAKVLGVTQAKLRSAVDEARPDRSAGGPQRGDDLAAALAKSLGAKTADVQAVLDATRQAGGGRPGPGDQSTLVSTLAQRLSVSRQKAQAAVDAAEKAHEAQHQQRETAMYAAVAKALGEDAAAVQKAFEANRPAMPTP